MLATPLLERLQEQAKPERSMPVERYRGEQLVKMIGMEVLYENNHMNLRHTGRLEGWKVCGGVYELKICSTSDLWGVKTTLDMLSEGVVVITPTGGPPDIMKS